MKKILNKVYKCALAAALFATSMSLSYVSINASEKENLALKGTATASYSYNDGQDPKYVAQNAIDGKLDTRWAAEPKGENQWLKVDLKDQYEFDSFNVRAEDSAVQKIRKFKIEGSNTDADGSWKEIYNSPDRADGFPLDYSVTLNEKVSYRYVKITIESLISGAYNSISLREFEIMGYGKETSTTPKNVNLALDKKVVASAEYSTMPASNLTDANKTSRWSTEKAPTQWAYVDLGESQDMNRFEMTWEKSECYATAYNIYVSDDPNNWGTAVVSKTDNTKPTSVETLKTSVRGRYVKLEVTKQHGYQNVSCSDFTVMLSDQEAPQDPAENVALNKKAVASSIEADSLGASNAFDGDTTSRGSRWASALGNGPHWIYVDLGSVKDVKTIKVFWETRKATEYHIQIANENPEKEASWTSVYEGTRPEKHNDKIVLDAVRKARYVRLLVNKFDALDPDGTISWNNISIYEMEVYGGEPKENIADVAEKIEIVTPKQGDKKLVINYPESEDYTIEYNGTDYEQIVDKDLTIYQPIVDTEVLVSFKLTDKKTEAYIFKEIPVVIPGKYKHENGDNKAPNVLPELREWKGHTGTFTISNTAKIVYDNEKLADTVKEFALDYEEITGKKMSNPVFGNENLVQTGDYFFTLTDDKSLGLMEEGSLMEVSNSVKVTAEDPTGAYWATRTILQSLKADNNIPCGIARDYPLYEVRGFILDVGRKTFTMDYLEQVVKAMSWYKMNDFQVHLNDNLIPLEHYNKKDENGNYLEYNEELMNAYSGFRLESNIKKGGNNGLNKADLTSKDVYYTKDEFRNFIKESRVRGVNVVPEIDTPAHSLALTKVRPDLRQGTNGRQNDHLDLINQYDESLAFVQSIFSEYMMESNPVFDEETTVHVGADEYGGSIKAYREFCNDMIEFVETSGRQARIWGSLTSMTDQNNPENNVEVNGEGVQINLWNYGWANMDEMYDLGFDLINCNDGNYYIVPNAGYYYDYLNESTLYNLPINTIGGVTIPAGDEQMIGGAFAVWNDMTDYLDNGVSEYDAYDRIENAIPLFGAKLWGKNNESISLEEANTLNDKLGNGPGTNFGYDVEANKNGVIEEQLMDSNETLKDMVHSEIVTEDGKNVLQLKGKESYASTNVETVGLGNDLRVKVKRTSDSKEEQILFESVYGSIKAVQKETGKVGFSRENFDYSFNYTLPLNDWVELEFKNAQNRTELYVNGKLVDVLGDDEKIEGRPMLATTMFGVERIGSKTNAFKGYVDDVRLGVNAEYNSAMDLEATYHLAAQLLEDGHESKALSTFMAEAKMILDQFAPKVEDINEMNEKLIAEIEKIEYKEADYSRVDAYLDLIPTDLTMFTDASVNVLEQAIGAVRRGLPETMQDTVNGFEKSLADALSGLELKEVRNTNYIDNALLEATADCYQDASAAPNKAIDGDVNTMWHSKWNPVEGHPSHWIALSSKEDMKVNGLTYVARKGAGNGTLLEYRIEAKDEKGNYQVVKEGKLEKTDEPQDIIFDKIVTTNSIRIVYLKATSVDGSAAEIMLHDAAAKPDIEGLKASIKEAESIKNENNIYTEESWNALQNKILEAKALVNGNPDANEVEVMKRELKSAMVGLKLSVNKDALNKVIEEAKAINTSKYTKESVQVLKDALAYAELVYADDKATQTTVQEATNALQKAINGLQMIEKPVDPETPDKPGNEEEEAGSKGPGTGDVTNLPLLIGLLGVSSVVISAEAKKRIKRK